ncbi:hypothetical protein [Nostoc sp. C117]
MIPGLRKFSKLFLELTEEEFQHLANQVYVIYHTGAIVKIIRS